MRIVDTTYEQLAVFVLCSGLSTFFGRQILRITGWLLLALVCIAMASVEGYIIATEFGDGYLILAGAVLI